MWSLQDAKARFSAVVDAALAGEPQEVTRRGKPAVVVVGAAEWARVSDAARAAGFAAHLTAIPTGDAIDRPALPQRDLDL